MSGFIGVYRVHRVLGFIGFVGSKGFMGFIGLLGVIGLRVANPVDLQPLSTRPHARPQTSSRSEAFKRAILISGGHRG